MASNETHYNVQFVLSLNECSIKTVYRKYLRQYNDPSESRIKRFVERFIPGER